MTTVSIYSNRLAIWQRIIYNAKVGVRLNETQSSLYHDNAFKFDRYVNEEEETEKTAKNYYGYSEVVNYKKLYQNQKERLMLKYLRLIDCIKDENKVINQTTVSNIVSKQVVENNNNKYIIHGLFYLNQEKFKSNNVPFSRIRLVNIYIEKTDSTTFTIKEIAFQEDRQKVIKFLKQQGNKLSKAKEKRTQLRSRVLLFKNIDILETTEFIQPRDIERELPITFKESKNKGHYLFTTNNEKHINIDQKILNILCPFKVIYEYKKLKLEPPLYWCYRYKKVLNKTNVQHGMFQLALSRLQNKWCRGTSIFNTILLMRYFMLSFYILADDKPVLYDNNNATDNSKTFLKNSTFLEASAKINEALSTDTAFEDTINIALDELHKNKNWPDLSKNLASLITSINSIVDNTVTINRNKESKTGEESEETNKGLQLQQFKFFFQKYLDKANDAWKQIQLSVLNALFTKTSNDSILENFWDEIKRVENYTNDEAEYLFLEEINTFRTIVKDRKKEMQQYIEQTLIQEVKLILDYWQIDNLQDTIFNLTDDNTKQNLEQLKNISIEDFLRRFGDLIVEDEKIKNFSNLEIEINDLITVQSKETVTIISDENLLNLYRAYDLFTEEQKTILFTNDKYFQNLRDYINNSNRDIILLYAQFKINTTLTKEGINNIFLKLTQDVQTYNEDDLYYIENMQLGNNTIDEKKKRGLTTVQNQIMTFMQKNDGINMPYKYVCDVFLKPAMRDTKFNSGIDVNGTKDIEFLKIIRDSLLYFIEEYDNIAKENTISVFEDKEDKEDAFVNELDYISSIVFEYLLDEKYNRKPINLQQYGNKAHVNQKRRENLILCHVFLYLYYDKKKQGNYLTYSDKIKKADNPDVDKVKAKIYPLMLYLLDNFDSSGVQPDDKSRLRKIIIQELGLNTIENDPVGTKLLAFRQKMYYWLLASGNTEELKQMNTTVTEFFNAVAYVTSSVGGKDNHSSWVKPFETKSKGNTQQTLEKLFNIEDITIKKVLQEKKIITLLQSFLNPDTIKENSDNKQKLQNFKKFVVPDIDNVAKVVNNDEIKFNSKQEEPIIVPLNNDGNDNDNDAELDFMNKQRFELIKEMEGLFITAKANVVQQKRLPEVFTTASAGLKQTPEYKNFLEYIVNEDPTPQTTIENMLNGYIEYVSHGIDLNNETNIQAFYAQTYKQFFQDMAVKTNRIKKQDQITKNIISIASAQRDKAFNKLQTLIEKRYSWAPFYMKKSNHYLCQSKQFNDVNETSMISFAHDLETFETVSLTYDQGFKSIHYQNYKVDRREDDNENTAFDTLNISSAQDYVYLRVTGGFTYLIGNNVNFKDDSETPVDTGNGKIVATVAGKNFAGNKEYIKIEITSGFCPDRGTIEIMSDSNPSMPITFNKDFKASFEEDNRTIRNVIAQSIHPYQVFLKRGTSVVFPNKESEDAKYYILRETGSATEDDKPEYQLVPLQQLNLSDNDYVLNTFTDIKKTNPYVLYFCNYLFMEQKNSFVFGKDFSATTEINKKKWERTEGNKNKLRMLAGKITEAPKENSKTYTYAQIALQNIQIKNTKGDVIDPEIIPYKITIATNTGTITNDNFTLEAVNIILNYDSDRSVDQLGNQFQNIARVIEGYNDGIYAKENNLEESIRIPFSESDTIYNIEYGTYEFLHHFFMGNLNKPNVYVKMKTNMNVIFKNLDENTVIPLYKYYNFSYTFQQATDFVRKSSYVNNGFLNISNETQLNNYLKQAFGYYEEQIQRYNSNFNSYKGVEPEFASRVACITRHKTELRRNKDYAAIAFGYNFNSVEEYGNDTEKGIESHRNQFHQGQRSYMWENELLEGNDSVYDLVAFYKNKALSFKKVTNNSNPSDLKIFLHQKGGGYIQGTNMTDDIYFIRNLIYSNKHINSRLKESNNNAIFNYGCFGIRGDLFESQQIEKGNFTFNSAMLKFTLPVMYHMRAIFEQNKYNYSELIFDAYFAAGYENTFMGKFVAEGNNIGIALQGTNATDTSTRQTSNMQQVKNYFSKIFINARELENVKIQFRQALRKTELRYMDYCDFELFYNVFVAEIIEDGNFFRVSNGYYDTEEFSNVTSGNIKERWPFFIRLALYEKYNYFLPMLQKNVSTPTFERLFKSEIKLDTFRKVTTLKHGKFEQWVYIYCLGLTVLLCE